MSVQQRICSVPVDAYVDGPPGQSTKKFGYDTELRVRGSAANTFQRAFIQFDAAACVPSAAIVKQPAPAAVNSATATDTNTTTTVAFDVTADVNAFRCCCTRDELWLAHPRRWRG